jgi:hypothetical protein
MIIGFNRYAPPEAVIEIKAVNALASDHLRQLEFYMAHFGIPIGYLINFNREYGFPGVDDNVFFEQIRLSGSGQFPLFDGVLRKNRRDSVEIIKVLMKRPTEAPREPPSTESNGGSDGLKINESCKSPGAFNTSAKSSERSNGESSPAGETAADDGRHLFHGAASSGHTASTSHQRKIGITKKGTKCRICMAEGTWCAFHRPSSVQPASGRLSDPVAEAADALGDLSIGRSAPESQNEAKIFGVTKQGKPCKLCIMENRFCDLHLSQDKSESFKKHDGDNKKK